MDSRGTILVVDDDREIGYAACLRLRSAGFEAIVAYDGQQGIICARTGHPRAILLDVRMPHMDGLTALDELKHDQETEGIPIIMLSASMCDEQAALDCGARYFLRKPYDGEELLVAVEAAMKEADCLNRIATSARDDLPWSLAHGAPSSDPARRSRGIRRSPTLPFKEPTT